MKREFSQQQRDGYHIENIAAYYLPPVSKPGNFGLIAKPVHQHSPRKINYAIGKYKPSIYP